MEVIDSMEPIDLMKSMEGNISFVLLTELMEPMVLLELMKMMEET